MKKSIVFLQVIILLSAIGFRSMGQNLTPSDFQKKIQELSTAPIVDVRTPGEFNQSHIQNAVNIDINNQSFPNLIGKLDKNKPVFVYCLSGSRSMYAARYMRTQGFKTVYDLTGGMIRWRASGLPESTGKSLASNEMSQLQFDNILNTDKLVLVDIYADWCAPCKKMAPSLEEIKNEMSDKINVVKINADQNKTLVKNLKVSTIPTLILYKSKKVIWTNSGFLSKEEIVSQLIK